MPEQAGRHGTWFGLSTAAEDRAFLQEFQVDGRTERHAGGRGRPANRPRFLQKSFCLKTRVLISADAEWRAVRPLFPEARRAHLPVGGIL